MTEALRAIDHELPMAVHTGDRRDADRPEQLGGDVCGLAFESDDSTRREPGALRVR